MSAERYQKLHKIWEVVIVNRFKQKSMLSLSAKKEGVVERWPLWRVDCEYRFDCIIIFICFPHPIDFNFQILVLGQCLDEFCWGVTFRWNHFVNKQAFSFFLVLEYAQEFAQKGWNRCLHISHNKPCLSPKMLHKHRLFISLRTTVIPKRN